MPFEEFDKRAAVVSKSPFVTVQRRGTMSLNRAAYDLMGSPEAVALLYDPEEKLIGFKPIAIESPRAFPVRVQGASASTYLVAGQAFTGHYGIDTSTARRYAVGMKDGVMVVDLRSESTDATGPRLKTRQRESG